MKYTVKWIIHDPTDHKLAPVEGQVKVEAHGMFAAISKAAASIKGSLGRNDVVSFKVLDS
jgi:hypothetical protein